VVNGRAEGGLACTGDEPSFERADEASRDVEAGFVGDERLKEGYHPPADHEEPSESASGPHSSRSGYGQQEYAREPYLES
jgi:hypothetical protein